jgi:hypothetical protein
MNSSHNLTTETSKQRLSAIYCPPRHSFYAKHLDLISSLGEILRNYYSNQCLHVAKLYPNAWKTAKVIMIPKPGKNLSEVKSYSPIPLQLIVLKLFAKLILKHQLGLKKKSLDNRPGASYQTLLSFLTLHKLPTEYGIEAYFIN